LAFSLPSLLARSNESYNHSPSSLFFRKSIMSSIVN